MAGKPSPHPASDWADLLAMFHQGDASSTELEACAADNDLPLAAAITANAALELDAALRRKALRQRIARAASLSPTVAIELSPTARRVLTTRPRMAAASAGPADALKEACEIGGTEVHIAQGRHAPRDFQLHRYLADGWELVVSIIPSDDVAGIQCGVHAMSKTKAASFVLALQDPDRTPAMVFDLCTRDLTVQFRDGLRVTLIFA